MRKQTYSRLDTLAQDIFAQRLILSLDGKVWTDDPVLQQNVRTNWPELVSMMEEGNWLLCPTHQAHQASIYFDTSARKWICRLCKRLHPEVSQSHDHNRTTRRRNISRDFQQQR